MMVLEAQETTALEDVTENREPRSEGRKQRGENEGQDVLKLESSRVLGLSFASKDGEQKKLTHGSKSDSLYRLLLSQISAPPMQQPDLRRIQRSELSHDDVRSIERVGLGRQQEPRWRVAFRSNQTR